MQLNEQGLYDIYALYYVPFWQRIWFTRILVLVLILFCLYTVYRIMRFWRAKRRGMTPEQRALARLEALRINDAMPERQAAYAYGIMTDVVKEYIQAVYGLSIRHLTDYECIERLRHSDLERALVEKLCRMFDDAAAIKFVQNPVAARTVQHDLQQIRDVIHATRVVQQSSTAVK